MTSSARIAIAAAFAALLTAAPVVAPAQTDPVAGTWKIKGKVQSFGFTLTCRFTRSGEALSGTCYDGGTNKPHALTAGKVSGDKVSWTYESSFMTQKFNANYSGVVKGGTISGTVEADGRKGAFSGSR
jgi:hypothetical protein